jgi:ATP-dependent helicase/nuclease subunit A
MLQQIERYEKQKQKINPILVKKYIKYIDWILLVYYYEKSIIDQIAELKIYTRKEIIEFCEKIENDYIDIKQIMEEQEINRIKIEQIEKLLKNKYPYELSTKIPTKSSVTKLKQKDNEKIEISYLSPKFTKKEENIKLSGSQKGILLHLCMQKLDEKQDYDLEKVKQLIFDLTRKEIITEKESENIDPVTIFKFTKSKIWKEMKQAKEIQKEKPFYITLSSKEIYGEDTDESILVQGIIDLYYINKEDELILVDYKTDFVQTEEELVNKYLKQLELYKKALEESMNKKVKSVFIYSTYLEKEIEILK